MLTIHACKIGSGRTDMGKNRRARGGEIFKECKILGKASENVFAIFWKHGPTNLNEFPPLKVKVIYFLGGRSFPLYGRSNFDTYRTPEYAEEPDISPN